MGRAQNSTGIDAGGLLPPPPADREWKGSRVAPFSGNVAFVLYTCPSSPASPLAAPSQSTSTPADDYDRRSAGRDSGTSVSGKSVHELDDDDGEGGDTDGGSGGKQTGVGKLAVAVGSGGRDDVPGQKSETGGGIGSSRGQGGEVLHVVRAAYNEHVIQLPGCGGLRDCPLDVFLVRPAGSKQTELLPSVQ